MKTMIFKIFDSVFTCCDLTIYFVCSKSCLRAYKQSIVACLSAPVPLIWWKLVKKHWLMFSVLWRHAYRLSASTHVIPRYCLQRRQIYIRLKGPQKGFLEMKKEPDSFVRIKFPLREFVKHGYNSHVRHTSSCTDVATAPRMYISL